MICYFLAFLITNSTSEEPGSGTCGSAVCISVCLSSLTPCTFNSLENLGDDEDTNRAWESVQENIKTSAKASLGLHEMKQHKPWFDEKCLGILDQRKQAKM